MQVVLLERVSKLGQMGDVVNVKDGYARNFLLPQGKALRANTANLERFENERAQLEARNLERKNDAEAVHARLNEQTFVIIRQSGDTGQLTVQSPRAISQANCRTMVSASGAIKFRLKCQLKVWACTMSAWPCTLR